MAWLKYCDINNWIETRNESGIDYCSAIKGNPAVGTSFNGSVIQLKRKKSIIAGEFIGIDQEAADKYVECNPSSSVYTPGATTPAPLPGYWTTTRVNSVRDGEGGAYKVIVETEIVYDWWYYG